MPQNDSSLSRKSHSSRLKIGLFSVALIASLPFLRFGLEAWHFATSDNIERAGIETKQKLASYERTGDPTEIRSWITTGPSEGPGTQVMMSLGEWACTHPREFMGLVGGLPQNTKTEFVSSFSASLGQSDLITQFEATFKSYKSPLIQAVLAGGY